MIADPAVWAAIPLIHHDRLIGIVALGAPEHRRAARLGRFRPVSDRWSSGGKLAGRSPGQQALANAQRFEEFNRRFAFILHDIKNLVSQLSLLARNAERRADNPEFRADMVATLQAARSAR